MTSHSLLIRDADLVLTMSADHGEGPLGAIRHGAVLCEEGRVAWIGPSADAPGAAKTVSAHGCVVLPGLVDCHTHAVWAGSRADEFERRLAGATYSEIMAEGGGILSTVRATREATLEALTAAAARRLENMRRNGVTTVEIKSGYGLTSEHEVKMLRAARAAGEASGVRVCTTFLGAHAVPPEFAGNRRAYVDDVIDNQLPVAAEVADFADVYVDKGAFSLEEGRRILEAARHAGLKVRAHAEQLAYTGAAQMAAELGATSADHLERVDEAGMEAMAASNTVAVVLPGAQLYLKDTPPPVERLRAHGIPMAVGSDLNPGSSPVHDLWTVATLACLIAGLTVSEALLGITRHGAMALGLSDRGHLRPGALGDLVVVQPPPGEPAVPGVLLQHVSGCTIREVVLGGAIR